MTSTTTHSRIIATMRAAAVEAGAAILDVYRAPFTAAVKVDGSPVTVADRAAEAIILERLEAAFPEVPIVSEERADSHALAPSECYFLVDPLDGTKEFIRRNGEFTVNIALIEHGVPVLGVVATPVKGELYYVDENGRAIEAIGGDTRVISARLAPPTGLIAAVSRSHLDAETTTYLKRFTIAGEVSAGSSLKFCLIARGDADIYPRFGRTMEWDTAAGDAVLRAAGGRMLTPDGAPFRYGKPGYVNGPYIARGA